jgi:hypothetical protein
MGKLGHYQFSLMDCVPDDRTGSIMPLCLEKVSLLVSFALGKKENDVSCRSLLASPLKCPSFELARNTQPSSGFAPFSPAT